MEIKNYKDYLREYLKTNYNVPEDVLDRYVDVLVNRAIRFYIDRNLDRVTVEEDMYGEDDDGNEVDTDAVSNRFPNLEYSEKEDLRRLEEESKYLTRD